jgi:hypothetical protein
MYGLRLLEDRLTAYIAKSASLSAWLKPVSKAFVNASGYRKMGISFGVSEFSLHC